MSTSIETNKHVVRELFAEALNRGRADVLPALIADEYTNEAGQRGPAAFAAIVTSLRAAFPDIRYDVGDVLAERDVVAVRWVWTGTHAAPFRGVAPTHRHVSNAGMAMFQLTGGKVVRAWLQTDRLGFLQALGVVPPDIGGGAAGGK